MIKNKCKYIALIAIETKKKWNQEIVKTNAI